MSNAYKLRVQLLFHQCRRVEALRHINFIDSRYNIYCPLQKNYLMIPSNVEGEQSS